MAGQCGRCSPRRYSRRSPGLLWMHAMHQRRRKVTEPHPAPRAGRGLAEGWPSHDHHHDDSGRGHRPDAVQDTSRTRSVRRRGPRRPAGVRPRPARIAHSARGLVQPWCSHTGPTACRPRGRLRRPENARVFMNLKMKRKRGAHGLPAVGLLGHPHADDERPSAGAKR